jgi:predicted site-specific integrase-resolvase
MAPLVVDLKTAASTLGVSVWTLRRFISDGLIPTVTYPSAKYPGERNRRVLIAVEDLERFVRAHKQGAA